MFPKIKLKYAKKKELKPRPITPRTMKAINYYVKTLHVRETYEFNKYK